MKSEHTDDNELKKLATEITHEATKDDLKTTIPQICPSSDERDKAASKMALEATVRTTHRSSKPKS